MSWSWTLREFYFRRTGCCSTITDIPLKRCKAWELISDMRGTFIQTISKEHEGNDAAAWEEEPRLRVESACPANIGRIACFYFDTTRCSTNRAQQCVGSRRVLTSKTAKKRERG